jgi:outer membrane protein OmpU
MKKILLASTALAFSAGMASAQVTVGGYGYMGVINSGGNTDIRYGSRLTFTGTVEADHGVTFSMFTRSSQVGGQFATGGAPAAHWTQDYTFVRVAGHGLTLTVGNTHGAVRNLARTAAFYGFNDSGIFAADTGDATLFQTDGAQNAYVSYAFDGLTVGASANLAGVSQVEIGARYSMSGFTIGAGINATTSAWAINAAYNGGDWTVGAGINSNNRVAVIGSYTFNDVTVRAAIENEGGLTGYGLDVGYNLGGGATLSATVGQARLTGVTTIGAGVFFSF